jgi:hypothetical protein
VDEMAVKKTSNPSDLWRCCQLHFALPFILISDIKLQQMALFSEPIYPLISSIIFRFSDKEAFYN